MPLLLHIMPSAINGKKTSSKDRTNKKKKKTKHKHQPKDVDGRTSLRQGAPIQSSKTSVVPGAGFNSKKYRSAPEDTEEEEDDSDRKHLMKAPESTPPLPSVTTTTTTTTTTTQNSHHRRIEFVYPRKNNNNTVGCSFKTTTTATTTISMSALPFSFQKCFAKNKSLTSSLSESSPTSCDGNKTTETTTILKSNESLDDILQLRKKTKNVSLSAASSSSAAAASSAASSSSSKDETLGERTTHASSQTTIASEDVAVDKQTTTTKTSKTTSHVSSLGVDDGLEGGVGKLSGVSVEDVIRDQTGCRPRANSTDAELNLPRRGLCDEGMVLAAHQWAPKWKQKIPKGFVNLGNTCFLNATIQCLAYIPPLAQCLTSLEAPSGKISPGRRMTDLLRILFRQVHDLDGNPSSSSSSSSSSSLSSFSNGSALAPRQVVKAVPTLGNIGSRKGYKFRPGRQEDAHEFLVHLLDAMHDGELKAAGINQHARGWRSRLPIPRLDETTLIHRIFGGYLRSQVRCTKCGFCSNTYDPFLDLALEVSKKSCNSIESALQDFTRKETLDSNNRWRCSGCRKDVCATKQLTVFRPPLSLCIQLKRFTFSNGLGMSSFGGYPKGMKFMGMGGGSKINKAIEFPARLKLALSDGRKCEYSLTGIVVHLGGSATSGHYTSFVKKPGTDGHSKWYHMDDSFVEPVSDKTVLKQKDVYVLFYSRTEVRLELPSPPLRSAMSAEEAKELSAARSRARSSSFSSFERNTVSENTVGEKPVIHSKEASLSEDAQRLKDISQKAKSMNDGGTVKTTLQKAKDSSKKTKSMHDGGTVKTTPSKAKDSDSGSSSTSSSSSSSSSSTSSKQNPRKTHTAKVEKATPPKQVVTSNIKSINLQGNDSDSSESSEGKSQKPATSTGKRDLNPVKSSSKNDILDDASVSESSDEESTGKNASKLTTAASTKTSSTTVNELNLDKTTNQKQPGIASKTSKTPGSESKKTRIVLDRGSGHGKLEVMIGPRYKTKKVWKPKTTISRSSDENHELLGTTSVSKWDDNDDAVETQQVGARAEAVRLMEKEENARKRSMHLDRWDAILDQGKKKKTKAEKAEVFPSDNPTSNPFHRIQMGIQRMNRGRAKGVQRKENAIPKRKGKTQPDFKKKRRML